MDSKLTDTIMVCSYNPKTQRASMLSIPRDTFIGKSKSTAKGSDKINSVYSRKGVEQSVKYVEEITGIDIEYYIVVNNQVVIDLVNDIGGVTFDVPINMNYDDPTQDLHIHLKKGVQKLNGDQAEQLLRFRKNTDGTGYSANYGSDDYGRMRTQREFLTSVAKQTLNIKNIANIKDIMETFYSNVKTNLKLNDIFPYATYAVNFDTENIVSYQLPGASEQLGLWFYLHDKDKTIETVQEMNDYLNAIDLEQEGNVIVNNTISNSTKINNTVK